MKVYILTQYTREDYEEPFCDIVGVYKNKEEAEKEKQNLINDNIQNFDFVIDKEYENRIFWRFQENWQNYIEFDIIEKEII